MAGKQGTKPPTVGIYSRISRDAEGLKLGVERQREDCEQLVQQRGWSLFDHYEDNDKSASRHSTKPRPDYERLLHDLTTGRIDGVVAYKSSRLTRRPEEFESFLHLCDTKTVLAFVAEHIDISTASGLKFARYKAADNAAESDIISESVRRAFVQSARDGKPHMTGNIPYGFAKDRVTHVPEEVAVIMEMADRVIAGEGLHALANEMHARGVMSKKGRPITVQTWRQILRSPRIAGFRSHHGEIFPAVWEPILQPDRWEVLLAGLAARSRGSGARMSSTA